MPVSSVEDMFKQLSDVKDVVGGAKKRGRRSVRKSKSPVRRSKSPVKKVKKATGGAKKSHVKRSKSPVRRSKSPVKRANKGKKGGVVDLSPFLASLLLLGTTLKFSKKGKKGTKRGGATPQDEENERINKIYLSENFKTSEKEKLHQRFEQERQDDQVFMNYRFKIYIYI